MTDVAAAVVNDPTVSRRRVAYVFHARSFPLLKLASTARKSCDVIWVVDGSDPDTQGLMRLIKRLGDVVDIAGAGVEEAADRIAEHAPDGILALSDDLLVWTSAVADRLGLPFATPETAHRLTDKYAQRAALREAGLAAPRSWRVAEDDIPGALERIRGAATFPVVLKPRKGEASRDTVPAATFAELVTLFDAVHVGLDGTPREFLVEEYIPDIDHPVAGDGFANYVSVEGFVCRGRFTALGVSGRTPPAPPFRETGLFFPAALSASDLEAVVETARRAADAIGITDGTFHTEIKLTPAGPVVIEVNGRIGGGVPEIVEAATGVAFTDIAFRIASGEAVVVPSLPITVGVGYYLMVQAPAGLQRVTAIDGLDELGAVDGVADIALMRAPGSELEWRDGNAGSVFRVEGWSADHEAFRELLARVESTVHIRGDEQRR